MKASIITITYNAEKTIRKTLESVAAQSYKNIEHIIVDGNSTDMTVSICQSYPHISKLLSEKDGGIYEAFNKGIKLASGDLIGFLNADDVFYDSHALCELVKAFDKATDCVFGNVVYTNRQGAIVRRWKGKPFFKGAFKKGRMPAHPTFYCRRSVYKKLGGYKENFKIAGDFELMLRFLENEGVRSKFLDKVLVKMLIGGISNNGFESKFQILKEEFRAFKINKLSLNKLNYVFSKGRKIKEFL